MQECVLSLSMEAVVGGLVSATFQKKLVMFLLTNKANYSYNYL